MLWFSEALTGNCYGKAEWSKAQIYLIKPERISGPLERVCRENCQNIPKSRCTKLVPSYSRILEAVMAPCKCLITEKNGLNTYVIL